MKRLLLLVLAVSAASAVPADAQFVGPPGILEPADAAELSALLADATEVQGICYGWSVTIFNEDSAEQINDVGSNLGPGQDAADDDEACPQHVTFTAEITYTSESGETEDYANFDILTNMPEAVDHRDLSRAGISNGRLLGENEDLAIIDAASAMPLIMAERGLAKALPLELNAEPLPDGDKATGEPGSDWARKNGAMVAVGVILLIVAITWALLARFRPNWIVDLTEGLSD